MRDRINAAQLGEFVSAAIELRTHTGRCALTMHDVVSYAWAPGVNLPEIATKDTLRKIGQVRRSLTDDEGRVIAPIALSYFRLVKRHDFTEIEAGACLPRRGRPQMGLLFIDHESSPKDILVWQEWLRREAATANTRGSEAYACVENALRTSLISEVESQTLLAIGSGDADEAINEAEQLLRKRRDEIEAEQQAAH